MTRRAPFWGRILLNTALAERLGRRELGQAALDEQAWAGVVASLIVAERYGDESGSTMFFAPLVRSTHRRHPISSLESGSLKIVWI
jgi:hypothetical protein